MGKGDTDMIETEASSAAPPAWWAAAETQLIGKLEPRLSAFEAQLQDMRKGLESVRDMAKSANSKAEHAANSQVRHTKHCGQ